jgi:hypothetical protein
MNARDLASQRRRALRFPLYPLLISIGATLLVFAGCGFNTHGTGPSGKGGEGGTVTCNTDAQCDDKNACTTDTCGADKICSYTSLDGQAAPAQAQSTGDCKVVMCEQGKEVEKPDPKDIFDDHEDCTMDSCVAGEVRNTAKADGTSCTDAKGLGGACEFGVCTVRCGPDKPCPAPTACQQSVACNDQTGLCEVDTVPDGTPTPEFTQVPGDCHQHVCIGGVDQAVVDDTDLPLTATDCDQEHCDNGVPSNPPLDLHAPCSTYQTNQAGFCDGAGTCRQCAQDVDCPGTTNDCQHPSCNPTTFTCEITHVAADTATTGNPAQVAGDCTVIVCDGNGGTINKYDSTDAADDNNACTADTCTAMNNTSHTAVADGTGCGNAQACLSGACNGCTASSQCAPASCQGSVLTKAQTCQLSNCVAPSPPAQDCAPFACSAGACLTTCAADSECAAGNFCSAGSCVAKRPNGQACTGGNQCTSTFCADSVCCSSACNGTCEACTAAKKGGGADGTCGGVAVGTDPDNECTDQGAVTCGNDGTCGSGNACRKYASGTACTSATCGGTVLTKAHSCNGSGTCTTPSPATQDCAPYKCTGGACGSSCASDADCASTAYCNGGWCNTKSGNGSACSASNQCASGACLGHCCSTACTSTGACGATACDTNGACVYPTGSTSCGTTCSGSTLTVSSCNGSGTCVPSSAACAGNYACNAGGTACNTTCSAPNPTGDAMCAATAYCNGVVCQPKGAVGAACTRSAECVSNSCNLGSAKCQ